MTILAKLKALEQDSFGYTTLVYELLESVEEIDGNYVMCVMFPRWEHKPFKLEDEGYLNIEFRKAGETTWFDGRKHVFYNHDNIQFVKFIKKTDHNSEKIVL